MEKDEIIPQALLARLKQTLENKGVLDCLNPSIERNIRGELALTCRTCGWKCFGATRLVDHMRSHTDERSFKCTRCSYSAPTNARLKKHMKTHEVEDRKAPVVLTPSVLTDREKQNLTSNGLIAHLDPVVIRNEKGLLAFNCPNCKKRMFGVQAAQDHLRRRHKEKLLKCDVCEYSATDKPHLEKHKYTHRDDCHSVCNVCNRSFKSPDNLRRHTSLHETTVISSCLECGKGFSDGYLLKMHTRAEHPDYKGIECQFCGKRFPCNTSLEAHKARHSDQRTHKCSTCDRRFKLEQTLKRHIKRHEKSTKCECYFCKAIFPDNILLKEHRNDHPELYNEDKTMCKCPYCGYQVKLWSQLIGHVSAVHKRDRSFKCTLCNIEVSCKSTLAVHNRSKKHKTAVTKQEQKRKNYQCYFTDSSTAAIDNFSKDKHKSAIIEIEETFLPLAAAVFQDSIRNIESVKIIWTDRLDLDLLTLIVTHPNTFICVLKEKQQQIAILRRFIQRRLIQQVVVKITNNAEELNVAVVSRGKQSISNTFGSIKELENCFMINNSTKDCVHFIRQSQASKFYSP